MLLTGTDNLLWAAGLLGHLCLLGVLLAKGRARQFPLFTALIVSNVLRTCLLKMLLKNQDLYLQAWLGANLLDCVLQLGVTYEVASHTFRPLGRWAPDTRNAILLLLGASLALGFALTLWASPAQGTALQSFVIRGNFFASALQTELFVGMLVLAATVGLPWKTHVARIAYGLGGFSLVGVLVGAAFSMYGKMDHMPERSAVIHTRQSLYMVCLLFWVVTLWREAPAPRELPPQLSQRLRALNARVAYDLYTLRSGRKS